MKQSNLRNSRFPRLADDQLPRQLGALETPAILVDLDRMATNLDRMATYTTLHGLALRPHVKTHKSPRIAAEQLAQGAIGLTCATPREMEIMSDVAGDLLLAYPPIGSSKLARLLTLPEHTRVTVALDGIEALDGLWSAARIGEREIGVYVEFDVGMRRVGTQELEEAKVLITAVRQRAPLRYAGIAFYPGHIRQHVRDQGAALEKLDAELSAIVNELDRAGLKPPVVSGGSTPAAWHMHQVSEVTEVRPGTYVYNDRSTAEVGACSWEDCALTVLATVVSTAVPGQAVIDAGSKALGREPLRAEGGEGFGALLEHPEVLVSRMSEEHGILELGNTSWRPEVGEQVRVVPNHVCIVVHLHELVYGVRGDTVETSWPVAARGRVRTSELQGS
jgi:D-serine deaminase-like pyridoxal phosphate-dependent protein